MIERPSERAAWAVPIDTGGDESATPHEDRPGLLGRLQHTGCRLTADSRYAETVLDGPLNEEVERELGLAD